MVAAWLLALVGAAAALLYGVIVVVTGCHGSDVSEAPPEGSAAAALCGWPLGVLYFGLGFVATAAPLVATRTHATRERLALGLAGTAGAIAAMAVLGEVVERGGWNSFLFVNLPVAIFVLALVLATIVRR